MAGSFPELANGETTQSGLVHAIEIRSEVQRFFSGAEQRYAVSGLLNSFQLSYSNLKRAEVDELQEFFVLQKGAFDHLWSLELRDPATNNVRAYEKLALDQDEFSVTETRPSRYSVDLNVVQTVGEPVTVALADSFPLLRTTAILQLPGTAALRYKTFRNDLEAGKRVSYYAWAEPLRRWPLDFTIIDNQELQTYVSFYLGQGGPVNSFKFTDPWDETEYENCRFAPGPVKITRVSKDVNRLALAIEQYRVPE